MSGNPFIIASEKQKRVQGASVTFSLKILSKIITNRGLGFCDRILNEVLL